MQKSDGCCFPPAPPPLLKLKSRCQELLKETCRVFASFVIFEEHRVYKTSIKSTAAKVLLLEI
jgi:hypothetical protein